MNNKIFSFLIAMAMTVAGITLTSCGSDDNGDGGSSSKATTVTAQPEVCIRSEMFDYFDITCTIDGETVALTKDNTYDTSYTPYTSNLKYDVRMYKVSAKQYTKFPAKMTVSLTSKVKAGVDLRSLGKITYLLYTDISATNNLGGKFAPNDHSTNWFTLHKSLDTSKATDDVIKKLENSTVTTTATFENAGSLVIK